jgi:AraC-like DNA-binding protein
MVDLVPFSFHALDLDRARAAIAHDYFPATLDARPMAAPYEFRFGGHSYGPVAVGHAWYTSASRVGIEEVGAVYVNFPERGTMRTRHRRHEVDVDPTRAAVFRPTGDVVMDTSGDYASFAVKIGSGVLEDAVEDLLGRSVARPLPVGPAIDLGSGAGAGWAQIVRFLVAESHSGRLAASPVTGAPLHEALVHGLLQAVEHPWREALDAPAPSFGPAVLRRVVEAVETGPVEALTVAGMARIAQVSVRTLQELYRRHLDTTPTLHLRQVRLARAHRDLRDADPTTTTVACIARRWGFAHTGRFAAAYRLRYGVPPSTTLGR